MPPKKDKGLSKSPKVAVDAAFFNRLKRLVLILIPRIYSKEFGLLSLFSGFLVSRTLLSLYVAKLDGRIVSSLVKGQSK